MRNFFTSLWKYASIQDAGCSHFYEKMSFLDYFMLWSTFHGVIVNFMRYNQFNLPSGVIRESDDYQLELIKSSNIKYILK